MTKATIDGRQLRAERSREAVVEAILAIYAEGDMRPGAAKIAERAGVSERSLFRYFVDLEDLAATAIDRQRDRVEPLMEPPSAEGDRHDRVRAIVDQRLRLHSRTMAVARAGMHIAMRSPSVAAAVEERRTVLRAQVAVHFRADLVGVDPAVAEDVGHALDLLLSLEGIDYLRFVAGVAKPVVRTTLVAAVEAVLATAVVPAVPG